MSRIYGKYIINTSLDGFFDPYNFTSNDRYAEVGGQFDTTLQFSLGSNLFRGMNYNVVTFLKNNSVLVKRACLRTPGSIGLNPSPAKPAAMLDLMAYDNYASGKHLSLVLPLFNQWCDVNVRFESFADITENYFDFKIKVGSKLYVDDYNVQAAYVGQPLKTVLELDVDTAGLYNGQEII